MHMKKFFRREDCRELGHLDSPSWYTDENVFFSLVDSNEGLTRPEPDLPPRDVSQFPLSRVA